TAMRRRRCRLADRPPLSIEQVEDRLLLATFTVTNTNDSGPGSLRQAILDADDTPNVGNDRDRIEFVIAGTGVHSIQPLTALPDITEAVIIDGYTQSGATRNKLANGDDADL